MILTPTAKEQKIIDPLIRHFEADQKGKRLISTFMNSLLNLHQRIARVTEVNSFGAFQNQGPCSSRR